jgi:hypothetical protein
MNVGPPELFILFFLAALLVVPVGFLWGLIDCASRPREAFDAAGSSKTLWLVLIVATWLIGLGWVLGWVYVLAVRPGVKRAQDAMRVRPAYPTYLPPPLPPPPPPPW